MRSSSAFCGSSFGAEANGRIGSSGSGAIRSRTGSALQLRRERRRLEMRKLGRLVRRGLRVVADGFRLFVGLGHDGLRAMWLPTGNQLWLPVGYRGCRSQIFRPFSAASSLSETSGRAPTCWITSAAEIAPSRAGVAQAHPPGMADQEAGGEQVAGAGRIHDFTDRRGRHGFGLAAGNDHAAFLAAGDNGKRRIALDRRQRAVEIAGLVERMQLALIGEHDVDGLVADQLEEFVAIAVDAERVRQASARPCGRSCGRCSRP